MLSNIYLIHSQTRAFHTLKYLIELYIILYLVKNNQAYLSDENLLKTKIFRENREITKCTKLIQGLVF